jgi:hypothetical protein
VGTVRTTDPRRKSPIVANSTPPAKARGPRALLPRRGWPSRPACARIAARRFARGRPRRDGNR